MCNFILIIKYVSRWGRYVQALTGRWKRSFPAHCRLHNPLFVVHCPSIRTGQREFTGVRKMKESIVNQERGNKTWRKLMLLSALHWATLSVYINSIFSVYDTYCLCFGLCKIISCSWFFSSCIPTSILKSCRNSVLQFRHILEVMYMLMVSHWLTEQSDIHKLNPYMKQQA